MKNLSGLPTPLENSLAREIRKSKIKRALLGSIAVAGILSVAAIAPNAVQLLKPIMREYDRQKRYRDKKAFYKLIEKGLVEIEKTKKGSFAKLTDKGKRALEIAEGRNYRVKIPRHWDKKWRVIIFDIPEKRKALRNRMRTTLMQIGFVRLQDSVWVYPYSCEELVILLKADFKIGKDLLYLIDVRIENHRHLKKLVNLPLAHVPL